MATIKHTSTANWIGPVETGAGHFNLGAEKTPLRFTLNSRMGVETATNPEELIAGALAGCYSMSLSNELESRGTPATNVFSEATVHLVRGEGGFSIPIVDLTTTALVDGISDADFHDVALHAETVCPVSQLLKAEVRLTARLGLK